MHNHDTHQRFSRHHSLDQMGERGQQILANAKVLIVGVGGLGCPAALYLAASGIGTLGLVDDDTVALSNLNRQILFETADIHRKKVDAARDGLHDLNPDVKCELHPVKLDETNAAEIFAHYDIIADGTDNVASRYVINRVARAVGKPLISAAIHGWQGQLYRFNGTADSACYHCLYPTPPREDEVPTCAESGVLSPLAGIMGCWQAAEIIKSLVSIGSDNQFIRLDLLKNQSHSSLIQKDAACPVCS